MKHVFLAAMLGLSLQSMAQQHFSINNNTDIRHHVGIVGLGSLSTEELAKVNSSGKFAAYIAPFIRNRGKNNWRQKLTVYASYNINAGNSDSLLASTVLLPELGSTSFLGTIQASLIYNDADPSHERYCLALFGEFSNKKIKADKPLPGATDKDSTLWFSTLNYTLGFKMVYTYPVPMGNTFMPVSLAIIPYLHWLNIPDEDNGDYRYLLNDGNLPSSLFGAGCKVIMAVNDFQFFADFRNTFDRNNKISNRDIKGFTSNIGVVVSASILEF